MTLSDDDMQTSGMGGTVDDLSGDGLGTGASPVTAEPTVALAKDRWTEVRTRMAPTAGPMAEPPKRAPTAGPTAAPTAGPTAARARPDRLANDHAGRYSPPGVGALCARRAR